MVIAAIVTLRSDAALRLGSNNRNLVIVTGSRPLNSDYLRLTFVSGFFENYFCPITPALYNQEAGSVNSSASIAVHPRRHISHAAAVLYILLDSVPDSPVR